MDIIAVIQARMSSSRFPGKVLQPILDKPMLQYQIERVLGAKQISRVVIATSTEKSDDDVENLIDEQFKESKRVSCFRGSLNDVLGRFCSVIKKYQCDHIVRLTGDCPLSAPELIDAAIELHLKNYADYTSNVSKPTYPDGFDVEVIKRSAILDADQKAVMPSEREHVTPYIRFRDDCFKQVEMQNAEDLSKIRLTVDYPRDHELIKKIFETLHPINAQFSFNEVVQLIDKHPELLEINKKVDRNNGYVKSLENDQVFLRSLKMKRVKNK